MYRAAACPCCASTAAHRYPAVVAPFVAEYALDAPPAATHLAECTACGFRYFEDRLTDAEAGRLYAGYRGERYFQVRNRNEPWYTRAAHDAVGEDAGVAAMRRGLVERFLRAHVDVAELRRMLDWGGDKGQILPQTFGEARAVYEISDVEPLPGIERIADKASLADRSFDLVMLCHVLEHCSEPRAVLEEVRPFVAPAGALYVEVPYERASLALLGKGRLYAGWLDALRHARPALLAMDLYSTACRIKLGALPPLGFVKLHEHINFFDETSLATLLEATGFHVLALERMELRAPSGISAVLGAVARRRG